MSRVSHLLSRSNFASRAGVAAMAALCCLLWSETALSQSARRPNPTKAKPAAKEVAFRRLPTKQPQPTRQQANEEIPAPPSEAPRSLPQLISLAEANSPRLSEAVSEIERARGRRLQAGLYPNPMVTGGGMQLGGSESQYFAQLSQEIITNQKRQISQAEMHQTVRQAEMRFLTTRFSLLANVRKGYAAVVTADLRIAALERLVSIARKSAGVADRLVESGEGAQTDALLMDIELEKAEVALENAKVTAAGARRQLAAIMGVRSLALGELEGTIDIPFESLEENVAVDGFIPQNADIAVAEIEVDRAKYAALRAEVEPFPNVTVNAGYMNQAQGMENMAILNLSIPVPIWNRNQGNIHAARAEVCKALNAAEQMQNEVAKEMAEAIARFRAARQQVTRYQQRIIPKSERSVQIIQKGFDTGEFDFQRLLQAQRSYLQAELGYIDSLEAQWNAAAELARIAQVEEFP